MRFFVSNNIGSNSLPALASAIVTAHAACISHAREAARHALEAGRLLVEAKEIAGHGNWSDWLGENCSLGERTAQRYMRLHKSGLKPTHVSDLSIRAASAQIDVLTDPFSYHNGVTYDPADPIYYGLIPFHPLATPFPLLGEEGISLLAESIRRPHGLISPITYFEGEILDGRCRYLACLKAGVEPKSHNFEGSHIEAAKLLIDLNLIRRGSICTPISYEIAAKLAALVGCTADRYTLRHRVAATLNIDPEMLAA
jgi:hypothetical protein